MARAKLEFSVPLTSLINRIFSPTDDRQRQNDLDLLTDYRERLMWSLKSHRECPGVESLKWTLRFVNHFHRLPDSLEAVVEFLDLKAPGLPKKITPDVLTDDIDAYRVKTKEYALTDERAADLESMILQVFDNGRREMLGHSIHRAAKFMLGDSPDKDVFPDSDDSVEWIKGHVRESLDQDWTDACDRGITGVIGEEIGHLQFKLLAVARGDTGAILRTGFPEIDQATYIGAGHNKVIGLLGASGGGKSTFTKALTLNFLRQGASVLFVAAEEQPEKVMEHFLWMNSFSYPKAKPYYRNLPDRQSWYQPGRNWNENVPAMAAQESMMRDWMKSEYAHRLDVKSFATMREIIDYYESRKKRKQYTVLVIDYVGHLDVETGKGRDEMAAHNADFLALSKLAARDSLVVMTPLQANTAGIKRAYDGEDEDFGRFDLGAIDTFRAANRTMELVIGVYADENLRQAGQVILSCAKAREGIMFSPVRAWFDAKSKMTYSTSGQHASSADDYSAEARERSELEWLRADCL